jgi:Tfp pilus assembly protein PilF
MGLYHYWGHRDYERALVELRTASRSAPGHAQLHHIIGAILRRQGKFAEGVREMEQALLLDPRNGQSYRQVMRDLKSHIDAQRELLLREVE